MKNLTPDEIIEIAMVSGLKMGDKTQPIFIEKFKANLEASQHSLNKMRVETIARALLAKSVTKKLAGTHLGYDSSDIGGMLNYKPELNDPDVKKGRWTGSKLMEDGRYADFELSEEEFAEFLAVNDPKKKINVKAIKPLLVKEKVEEPAPVE